MDEELFGRPEVDALYALDPSEFVAARDALAKELKAAGDEDAAVGVKGLKRPTKAAWAINQVARERPDDVAALLAAGQVLRDRQADALSGGDAGALRDAATTRREAVRTLVTLVVELAGDTVREDASATFETASVDDEASALVASGRLTTTLDRPSDMGFGGMPDPPPRPAPRPKARAGTSTRRSSADAEPPEPPVRLDRRRIQKLEGRLAAAERDARSAEDELVDAERRLSRAEEALATAEQKRDDASTAREAAVERRTQAMDAVDATRAELEEASDSS